MGSEARLLARLAVLEALAQGQDPSHLRFEELQQAWDEREQHIRDLEAALAQARERAATVEASGVNSLRRATARYAEQALALLTDVPTREFPRGFFVYILSDAAGAPVYVGQSRNLLGRLGQHACDPLKADVVSYSVLRCESQEHMDATEQALIAQLRPPLNITFNRTIVPEPV